jgi:hypothetical protein
LRPAERQSAEIVELDPRSVPPSRRPAPQRALGNFQFGDPPAPLDKRLHDPFSVGLDFYWQSRAFINDRFARKVGDAFYRLGEAITVIAYNLDYDGYRHLRTFAPVIVKVEEGSDTLWTTTPTADPRVVERCVAFAIDAALRLENAAARSAM